MFLPKLQMQDNDLAAKIEKLTSSVNYWYEQVTELECQKQELNLNVPAEAKLYNQIVESELPDSQKNLETDSKILKTLQRKLEEGNSEVVSKSTVSKRPLSIEWAPESSKR